MNSAWFLLLLPSRVQAGTIDRAPVVRRHTVSFKQAGPIDATSTSHNTLTVGNGEMGFGADLTGLHQPGAARVVLLLPVVGRQLDAGVEGLVEYRVFQAQPVRPILEAQSKPVELVATAHPGADVGHRDHRLGELRAELLRW